MIKILNQSDVTNLYLSLMDIITKERASIYFSYEDNTN